MQTIGPIDFSALPRQEDIAPLSLLRVLTELLKTAKRVHVIQAISVSVETTGHLLSIRRHSDGDAEVTLFSLLNLDDVNEMSEKRTITPQPALAVHTALIMAAKWAQEHGRIVSASDSLTWNHVAPEDYDPFLHDWEAVPAKSTAEVAPVSLRTSYAPDGATQD